MKKIVLFAFCLMVFLGSFMPLSAHCHSYWHRHDYSYCHCHCCHCDCLACVLERMDPEVLPFVLAGAAIAGLGAGIWRLLKKGRVRPTKLSRSERNMVKKRVFYH